LCRHVSSRSWRAPTGFQVIRLATRRSITKLWTNRCSVVSRTSFRCFRRTSWNGSTSLLPNKRKRFCTTTRR
jgi:hypothetical protein